jgi:nucleoside-diphosphate-sugar epimerase
MGDRLVGADCGVWQTCTAPATTSIWSGHVIPAMIAKFTRAVAEGTAEVVLWGAASPTREFLYVEDAAEAIVLAAERGRTGAGQHRDG